MKNYKFFNLDFSINQQSMIIEYAEGRDFVTSDVIQGAIEASLKVSFSYDNFHNCALLSLTPKDKDHLFYGYIVSIRHEDIYTLVKILVWLVGTDWVEVRPPEDEGSKYTW